MPDNTNRLYGELAWLWPLWGSVAEYRRWSTCVTCLVERHIDGETRTLLNMGCGGGKNAFNLKRWFDVTGIDISPQMVALARELNPECTFVQADMRDFSLGREFDAVLIDDAVSYMVSRAELAAAFRTAYAHLRPGGVLVVSPDETTETFRQNQTHLSQATSEGRPEGLDVVFVENYYDPDPGDERYEGTMIYLIRRDGQLSIEHDHHVLGLFPLDAWRAALAEAGFDVYEETCCEEREGGVTFVGVRPA
jgi:SAM-dependent methyltransferase